MHILFLRRRRLFRHDLLTSSIYSNVYDNQKWNFAVSVKSKNWPHSTGSVNTGENSTDINRMDITFMGYNVENGVVKNEFVLTTSSVHQVQTVVNDSRFYIGAQRKRLYKPT